MIGGLERWIDHHIEPGDFLCAVLENDLKEACGRADLVVAFARRKKVWLHVDVDVVDAAAMPAVVFPAPGGASLAALGDLITQLVSVADVRGFEVCGYDPKADARHRLPLVIAGMFGAYARTAVPAT